MDPDLTANRAVGGINFFAGAFSYTIGSSTGSTLRIGSAGAILNSATNTQTFASSITLAISASQTWANNGGLLIFNGTVNLNDSSSSGRTLTVSGSGNTTFAGVIQNSFAGGTGNFANNGSGIVTLSNTNTYNGATTLGSGSTTLINGNQAAATGVVSVNNGGTLLGGIGTIGGAVTLNSGSSITGATNGTVGTLTLQNGLTVNGTSGYLVDLSGSTSDRLSITGLLDLSTSTVDRLIFSGTANGTSIYTLATYSSHTGIFDNVTNLPMGYQLNYGSTALTLAPVPEPSTWAAGVLTLLALGYTQRRRLKNLGLRFSNSEIKS